MIEVEYMRELDRVITFGGEVIPAYVASTPHIIRPQRKVTVTPIAGSNREYVDMQDAWENYDQPYSLFLGDGSEDCVQGLFDAVAAVLYKTGYQELTDDFEPDIYRLAYYVGGFDAENRYTRLGKFDITFRCRPERYLLSGKHPVDITSGEQITNPTAFNAKPLIYIEGSGSGTLTVAGTVMSFTGITDYLYIDCDKMDVYRQPTENRNSLMTGEFPVLPAGNSTITFTGGITAVKITPRFWVI